jgi:hypothetical protein
VCVCVRLCGIRCHKRIIDKHAAKATHAHLLTHSWWRVADTHCMTITAMLHIVADTHCMTITVVLHIAACVALGGWLSSRRRPTRMRCILF